MSTLRSTANTFLLLLSNFPGAINPPSKLRRLSILRTSWLHVTHELATVHHYYLKLRAAQNKPALISPKLTTVSRRLPWRFDIYAPNGSYVTMGDTIEAHAAGARDFGNAVNNNSDNILYHSGGRHSLPLSAQTFWKSLSPISVNKQESGSHHSLDIPVLDSKVSYYAILCIPSVLHTPIMWSNDYLGVARWCKASTHS